MHTVVNHFASPDFWACYRRLPAGVWDLADKSFALLEADPAHPSVRFKKVGEFWSARVGLRYRALAKGRGDGVVWFWIGPHAESDQILA